MRTPALTASHRQVRAESYSVIIGAGVRHDYVTWLTTTADAHHFAVISDTNVAPLYGATLVSTLNQTRRATLHMVPAGEASKTRERWARLTDELLAAGCGRDTTIVALGGGVIGDLAGFVAATYMRGVPVVQCPTSLLAMIDASVGSKTGVDTPAGKNLVGAFHPPAIVLMDVETISSLPLPHRRAGLAEAIKHGVIADAGYLASVDAALPALLDAEPNALVDCVTRSVEIKAEVVASDPREQGRRRILNFGHTLGHAMEQVSGYSLLHGEAVAIGMALETRLAERVGVAEQGTVASVEQVLSRAGLPVSRPAGMSADAIVAATRTDKKSRAGSATYALPRRVGEMAGEHEGWAVPVDEALVRDVLA